MEQGPADASPSPRPTRSTGRAFALYTTLRLLLFLAVYLVLQVFLQPALLAVGAAVLISALLAVPLLKPWRHDLTAATSARLERKQAEREQRRARLDENVTD